MANRKHQALIPKKQTANLPVDAAEVFLQQSLFYRLFLKIIRSASQLPNFQSAFFYRERRKSGGRKEEN